MLQQLLSLFTQPIASLLLGSTGVKDDIVADLSKTPLM
jgi:hypothetical protein